MQKELLASFAILASLSLLPSQSDLKGPPKHNVKEELLMEAIQQGNVPVVSWLVKKNASVNYVRDNGFSLLDAATELKSEVISCRILKVLLSRGADANYKFRSTPIAMISAGRGRLDEVGILFDFGYKINTKSESGDSALSYASSKSKLNRVSVAVFLINRGAKPTIGRTGGKTALQWAKYYQDKRLVNVLESANQKISKIAVKSGGK